ncbi:MAG: DUF4974 domain-containing protein, partial [Bacteroidetes bacterium]|nr:DUF4974 domain-containing protein [Bacteroidota bacterium]
TVTITGEAYFDVAKNPASPFVVMAAGLQTNVLGTAFNISAYDNEARAKVTLIEGAVGLTNGKESHRLQPGEQGQLDRRGVLSVVENVNTEEAIAWKSGRFEFDETDVQSVMRQLARWYDVEIHYEGNISKHISGTIARSVSLSKVLDMLQKTGGLGYKMDGNKIIVKP